MADKMQIVKHSFWTMLFWSEMYHIVAYHIYCLQYIYEQKKKTMKLLLPNKENIPTMTLRTVIKLEELRQHVVQYIQIADFLVPSPHSLFKVYLKIFPYFCAL